MTSDNVLIFNKVRRGMSLHDSVILFLTGLYKGKSVYICNSESTALIACDIAKNWLKSSCDVEISPLLPNTTYTLGSDIYFEFLFHREIK